MIADTFSFLALADLTACEAVAVMACLCVATAAAMVCVARWLARDDARRAEWPVSGSPCEDPEL